SPGATLPDGKLYRFRRPRAKRPGRGNPPARAERRTPSIALVSFGDEVGREQPADFRGDAGDKRVAELLGVVVVAGRDRAGAWVGGRDRLLVYRAVIRLVQVEHGHVDLAIPLIQAAVTAPLVQAHGHDFEVDHVIRLELLADLGGAHRLP